ncbi:hypothetical protein T484DRAFT_1858857 [Baffinella frigidus]|nr:hypothetical protein T484DRAFT_1858857 [Cryptophyta sp. CCMP2293]
MSPPPNECVETVKAVMAEVVLEKDQLVARLNEMKKGIDDEKDLEEKVRLQVEWTEEKERSVKALNPIVASLQRALEEHDATVISKHPRASREDTDSDSSIFKRTRSRVASSRPRGAFSQSFTNKHSSPVDRNQADFAMMTMDFDQDLSYAASQDGAPRQRAHRSSSAPPRSQTTSPLFKHPARLNQDAGEEPADAPAPRRSLPSNEEAQTPQQERRPAPATWPLIQHPARLTQDAGRESTPAHTPACRTPAHTPACACAACKAACAASTAAGMARSLSHEAAQIPLKQDSQVHL